MLKTEPTAGIESKRTAGERVCAIKHLNHSRTTQRGSSKQSQFINRLRVGIPYKDKVSETFLVPIIQITFFINRLKVIWKERNLLWCLPFYNLLSFSFIFVYNRICFIQNCVTLFLFIKSFTVLKIPALNDINAFAHALFHSENGTEPIARNSPLWARSLQWIKTIQQIQKNDSASQTSHLFRKHCFWFTKEKLKWWLHLF